MFCIISTKVLLFGQVKIKMHVSYNEWILRGKFLRIVYELYQIFISTYKQKQVGQSNPNCHKKIAKMLNLCQKTIQITISKTNKLAIRKF